jgi:hypothetical protein
MNWMTYVAICRTMMRTPMMTKQLFDAKVAALVKLQRIIDREGDAGGARRKKEYLEQLTQEALQERTTADFLERRYFRDGNKRVCALPQLRA